MNRDLYRISFLLRGEPRSLLLNLPHPPTVGDRLTVDNLTLVVTGVKTTGDEPATILAVVEAVTGSPDPTGTQATRGSM